MQSRFNSYFLVSLNFLGSSNTTGISSLLPNNQINDNGIFFFAGKAGAQFSYKISLGIYLLLIWP